MTTGREYTTFKAIVGMWETRAGKSVLSNSDNKLQSHSSLQYALTPASSYDLRECREMSPASNLHTVFIFHVRSFVFSKFLDKKCFMLKEKSFDKLDDTLHSKNRSGKIPKLLQITSG